MKKGLRLATIVPVRRTSRRNRRPDEEGIKTWKDNPIVKKLAGIVDLMKKGLRRCAFPDRVQDNAGIVDLMKKGLRPIPSFGTLHALAGIVDLMKKGLRHPDVAFCMPCSRPESST